MINYHDISERRAAEQQLLERDERSAWLPTRPTMSFGTGISPAMPSGGTKVSKHFFGYPPRAGGRRHRLVARGAIHTDEHARVLATINAAIGGEAATWAEESRFRCFDGSDALVLDRGFIIRDAAGKATRMLGSMQDIGERKAAEAALRASEASLAAQAIAHLGSWEFGHPA